jgi:hypothetical protein
MIDEEKPFPVFLGSIHAQKLAGYAEAGLEEVRT